MRHIQTQSDLLQNTELWEGINFDFQTHEPLRTYLGNYLSLTKFSSKFNSESGLDIYYNRLYWFSKVRSEHNKLTGREDAGLSQQFSDILQEGDRFPDIDWKEVEQLIREEL
jgi:hypothetical protein